MSSASIEHLPPEMISMLFRHLPPKDLAVCSMVNRRWYSIYAVFKLHRLVAIGNLTFGLGKWSYPDRRIEAAERCSPANFLRFVEKPQLSNLKYLLVSGRSFEFKLSDLNRLSQLVHLEIDIGDLHDFEEPNWKINLNLPKLKVLVFHCFNRGGPWSLWIDCPLLSTLVYPGEIANRLKMNQPETIRRLETNLVGQQLTPFKNIECLVTKELRVISKATLLSLTKLRELRYTLNIEDLNRKFSIDERSLITVDQVKRTLNELMKEAKKLRGRDFRFTFSGFQLTNMNLDQIDFGAQVNEGRHNEWACNEYVYMKNYHLIEPSALYFVELVRYNGLLSNLTGEFPRCFFEKFTSIEEVEVDGLVKDPNHLLWFLKSLRFLKGLWLNRTGVFSQEFYDQLPTVARSLIGLEFRGDWTNEVQVNFNFLNEFSSLSSLESKQALSFESAASLVRSSVKLVKLWFDVHLKENYSLCAVKERGWFAFKIFKLTQPLFETGNPDETVDFLEGLRASVSH